MQGAIAVAIPQKELKMSDTTSPGRSLMYLTVVLGLIFIGLMLQYAYIVLPKTTTNEIIRIHTMWGSMEKFDPKKKTWEPYTITE